MKGRIITRLFLIALLGGAMSQAIAQSDAVRQSNFNIKKSVAIEGYDPVSYFNGKPAEGNDDLFAVYRGVKYLFENKTNLDRFRLNPENYEPAYGGWCAFAMGKDGEKVKIDPETYKIRDGRLYLFYNFWGNNTLKDWNLNEKELKVKGDQHWAKFLQKK